MAPDDGLPPNSPAPNAALIARQKIQQQCGHTMAQLKQRLPRSNSQRFLLAIFILTAIADVFVVGGALLAGMGITLLLAAPLFLLFSPILVPLGVIVGLGTAAFVTASVAFVSFSWLLTYLRGKHPVGSDKVDAFKHRVAHTASHVTGKARDATHNVSVMD